MSNKKKPDIPIMKTLVEIKRIREAVYFNCYCIELICCPACKSENVVHEIDPRDLHHYWVCMDCNHLFESSQKDPNGSQIRCRCPILRACPYCKSPDIRHQVIPYRLNNFHHWVCKKCHSSWLQEGSKSKECQKIQCPDCSREVSLQHTRDPKSKRFYCKTCKRWVYLREVE